MSQSQYNQTVTLANANTAYAVEVPQRFDRVIVANLSGSGDVYVSTSGLAAGTGEGEFGGVVLPGAWRMLGNDQASAPLVSKTVPGSTVQNTGFGGVTHPNLNLPASGYPTYVSLMSTVAGNVVELEFV